MKKTLKPILIILIIVVVLGVAAVIFMNYYNKKTDITAVSNLSIKTEGTTQTLSWDVDNPEWYYEVYKSDDGGTTYNMERTVRPGETTKVAFAELEPAHVYQYKVVACFEFMNDIHKSGPVYAKGLTAVAKVETCTATPSQDNYEEAEVEWEPAKNATGYELRYSQSDEYLAVVTVELANADVQVIEEGQTEATKCKYTITGLDSETTYYVSVRSYTEITDKDYMGKQYADWSESCEFTTSKKYSQIRTLDGTAKMVALTFDDGPEANGVTASILDTLSQYGAKATFFSLGDRASYNPDIMQRIVAEGHEVGNHTYDHVNVGSAVTRDDIVNASNAIQAASGVYPTVFRSPGGETTDTIRSVCEELGMSIYYWSVDTRDWESRDAASVIQHVQNETYDGSIILMHNIYSSTAEAVQTVVPWLIEQGYELVTVSELINAKTGEMPVAGVQYYDAFSSN